MPMELTRRCAVALFTALALATLAGLLAGGPLPAPQPDDHAPPTATPLMQWLPLLPALPLIAAGLACWHRLQAMPERLPGRTAGLALCLALVAGGLAALLQTGATEAPARTVSLAARCAAAGLLALWVLADRLGPRWGDRQATCLMLAMVAAGACLAGPWGAPQGDLRALVWTALLPLLVALSGLTRLPRACLRRRPALAVLLVHATGPLLVLAGLAQDALPAMHLLDSLQQLVLAGTTAWLVYGAGWLAASTGDAASDELSARAIQASAS